jgi:hypothetical protein
MLKLAGLAANGKPYSFLREFMIVFRSEQLHAKTCFEEMIFWRAFNKRKPT